MNVVFPFLHRGMHALVLAGFLTVAVASAQETGNLKDKQVTRGVRFVCAGIAKGTPEILQLVSKKGLMDVPLSVRSPGSLFAIPTDGVIRLGLKTENKEHPFTSLAVATMPNGATHATAILFPAENATDGTRYRMLLIDDKSLTGGDVYFINTLKQRCSVRLDDKQFILTSGKPIIHHTGRNEEAFNASVAISVEHSEKSAAPGWDLITASTWRLMPTRIEVCLIYLNSQYQRPALMGLTFFPNRNETPINDDL
jgi:hypothetical protein